MVEMMLMGLFGISLFAVAFNQVDYTDDDGSEDDDMGSGPDLGTDGSGSGRWKWIGRRNWC